MHYSFSAFNGGGGGGGGKLGVREEASPALPSLDETPPPPPPQRITGSFLDVSARYENINRSELGQLVNTSGLRQLLCCPAVF